MSDKYPGGFVTANAPAGFSVAFDGTGDYLSMASGTSLGAGNFTIECWVYLTAAPAGETTVGSSSDYYTAGFNGNFVFRVGTTNLWRSFDAQSNQATIDGTFTWSTGQWYHMAWVRNSGTVTVYRNGTSLGSVADSKTLSDSTNGYAVAATKSGGSYSSLLTGYISNLRVVVGTALYTTTFTPPTQLLNISGTSLLTCNSPTIIDQSTNAYAITVSGNAAVSNFTPFAAYQGFNPALGAAAGGVWTIDESAYYQQNRLWPIYDPYFNQTTLMLHGNSTGTVDSTGTPVYQNNTFLDSSTNNFTITRNGNTTQGSFSPFSQTGWSNYFSTSPFLSVASNTAFDFGSGDATQEMWIYPTTAAQTGGLFDKRSVGSNYSQFPQVTLESGVLKIYVSYTGSSWAVQITGATPTPNVWTHIALVRYGNTWTLYVNGVVSGTPVVASGSVYASTDSLCIGASATNGHNPYTGYISNVRIVKGTAVYTSNFTPSNAPLTAVTGTTLLTCQSSRFVDNSANNFSITLNNTPSVQAFSPFVPAYITPTTYSNYFDGTGDYLSSSSANYTATGDFTAEAWFYATSNPSFGGIINTRPQSNTTGWGINLDNTQKIRFYINGTDFPSGFVSYNLNQWYHVALVRSGSTVTGYINGISAGTTTNSSTTSTTDLVIGRFYADLDNYYLNGVVSNARFVNGTAIYTANFTPPNAPFPTGTTNQQLLTCQASTMIDSNTYTTAKTITANGNVRPVTSPTPFPAKVDTTTLNSAYSTSLIGGSGYFDGSGDYLNFTDSTNIFNGSFTAECWFYRLGNSAGSHNHLLGNSSDSSSGFYWAIREGGSGLAFQVNLNGGIIDYAYTASQIPINAWTNLAIVKSGSTLTGYINGVAIASGTVSNATSGITTTYLIGRGATGGGWSSQYANGYISSYRLSTVARTISIPTAPLTAIANTEFLANFTNGAIFDNTAKNVLETVGNAQISITQSKWGGSSIAFDGTGDYLVSNSGTDLYAFGSGNFTIEFWVYFNTVASQVVYDGRPSGVQTTQPAIYMSGAGVLFYYTNGTNVITGATLTSGQWYHIAVSRSGTSTKMFLNGVQTGSTYTDSTVYTNTAGRPIIGVDGFSPPSNPLNGYVDDMRVTKGVARYTTNFTPPTSQLQDQ